MVYTIEEIKEKVEPIAKKYQVPKIYIFGSYARGQAKDTSDIDFIVNTNNLSYEQILNIFSSMYDDLEMVFHQEVDIIDENDLYLPKRRESAKRFVRNVLNERELVYELQ
ncbi:hypothetical protein SAMN02745116_01721 [Pilibacter termitis]|uniref:Polymerase beta nucleotidyltransferase domain-containing protein n=1 Tax=Pilibacter termitis TaxID=263852 RepID=A0A1T4PAH1_9ENTE|nr:nucleotidyltransferase domain-containing protein [Pilibacter termitis]SJZ88337.1 hypothetical protein SAMN02745116_01721 [Pilibacter termitis]